ncbi:MAG: hypothetical protein IJO97_02325 [Lachnospiraceae bacterium]|nr:hypothetical protein [Lachnospiraceae bacterium]
MKYLRALKNRVGIVTVGVFLMVCAVTVFVLLLKSNSMFSLEDKAKTMAKAYGVSGFIEKLKKE